MQPAQLRLQFAQARLRCRGASLGLHPRLPFGLGAPLGLGPRRDEHSIIAQRRTLPKPGRIILCPAIARAPRAPPPSEALDDGRDSLTPLSRWERE